MDRLDKSTNLLRDVTRGIPSHSKLLKLDDTLTMSTMAYRDMTGMMFNNSVLPSANKRKTSKFKKSDLRDLSLSIALDDTEMASLLEYSMASRIMDEDIVSVSEQFQEVLELHSDSQSVFNAIQNFIEILNKTISALSTSKDTVYNMPTEIGGLINERNTWLLIHALYKDRELSRCMDDESEIYSTYMSEKQLVDLLYKQHSSVRECQMVVDWLERVSREEAGDYPKVPHFTDPTVCWENTLHQIQNSTLPAYSSSRQLVKSLDPDAPSRENKHLHDTDHDDQYRLFTEIFKEIRMGRLDKAQSLCLHCGQAWLAVVLEGWRLYHDPNKEPTQLARSTVAESEGNDKRGVWKWIAWNLCEGDGLGHIDSHDALERAIYGAFCGHVDSLRPLCTSWEDQLWAYTRTSIDVRVEKEIRDNSVNSYEPLPDKYWNSFYTLEEIFNKLKATSELKFEANSICRLIQELVCLDRSQELVETMSSYLENSDIDVTSQESCNLIRFMTHIVLILRMLGISSSDHHSNNIIRAYVKVLGDGNNGNLVAFYCSKLQPDDQIEEYSMFLSNIQDINKKLQCLQYASQHELHAQAITHRTASIIWSRCSDKENELGGTDDDLLNKETNEIDLIKIEALDWMILYKEQRSEAIIEANNLIRSFISKSKIDAARRAHNKLPDDSLDVVMAQFKCTMNENGCLQSDNLPPRINSAISEYLAYKAYLDAQDGFSNWFKMFHSRPSKSKIDNIEELSDFTKQVSLIESQRHMNEKYQSWKAAIDHITRTVKAQLYNVLVFPPRGWLVDIFTSDSDKTRRTQLDSLRSLCIPEIILLLHTLLDSMELYEDCLDLCTVVTSEEHQIYKVLSKQELRDLLEKLAASCLKLSCIAPDAFALAPPIEPSRPLQITL